jgi:hypothetical protein
MVCRPNVNGKVRVAGREGVGLLGYGEVGETEPLRGVVPFKVLDPLKEAAQLQENALFGHRSYDPGDTLLRGFTDVVGELLCQGDAPSAVGHVGDVVGELEDYREGYVETGVCFDGCAKPWFDGAVTCHVRVSRYPVDLEQIAGV